MRTFTFIKGESKNIFLNLADNISGGTITPVSASFSLFQDNVILAGYPATMSYEAPAGVSWQCAYTLDTSVLSAGLYEADMQATVTGADGLNRTFIERIGIQVTAAP